MDEVPKPHQTLGMGLTSGGGEGGEGGGGVGERLSTCTLCYLFVARHLDKFKLTEEERVCFIH